MEAAQEQGMWRAIGEVEGNCISLQEQVEGLRKRDRLSFAGLLLLGFVIGAVTVEIQRPPTPLQIEAEGEPVSSTYRCPGPTGITPPVHAPRGGI